MKRARTRAVLLGTAGLLAWSALLWAQSVSISVTSVNNALSITASEIVSGVATSARAFDLSVTASADFTVSVRLDDVLVNGGASSIPAAAFSLTANASGEAGTLNVAVDPFTGFGTEHDLSAAFSGQAGASGETSQIDVQLNLDQLGDRAQNDALDFNLTFTVTEQL